MTAGEWAQAVGAILPAVVAVARTYQLHDRVRKLEAARESNGARFGQLEKSVDYTVGRVDELSRRLTDYRERR